MGYLKGFINEGQDINYSRQRLKGIPERKKKKEINFDIVFSPSTSDRRDFTCI